MRKFVLCVTVLLVLAGVGHADVQKIQLRGKTHTIEVPAGWKLEQSDKGVVLRSPQAPKPHVSVTIDARARIATDDAKQLVTDWITKAAATRPKAKYDAASTWEDSNAPGFGATSLIWGDGSMAYIWVLTSVDTTYTLVASGTSSDSSLNPAWEVTSSIARGFRIGDVAASAGDVYVAVQIYRKPHRVFLPKGWKLDRLGVGTSYEGVTLTSPDGTVTADIFAQNRTKDSATSLAARWQDEQMRDHKDQTPVKSPLHDTKLVGPGVAGTVIWGPADARTVSFIAVGQDARMTYYFDAKGPAAQPADAKKSLMVAELMKNGMMMTVIQILVSVAPDASPAK